MFKLYLRMIAHWFSQTRLSNEKRAHTHTQSRQSTRSTPRARAPPQRRRRTPSREGRATATANPKQSPSAHPSAARLQRAHRAHAPSRARHVRQRYLCANPRPCRAPSHPASTTRPPRARHAIDRARHPHRAPSIHHSVAVARARDERTRVYAPSAGAFTVLRRVRRPNVLVSHGFVSVACVIKADATTTTDGASRVRG